MIDVISCFRQFESDFFLDSQGCRGIGGKGDFDFLVFGKPSLRLIQWPYSLEVVSGNRTESSNLDIFDFISDYIKGHGNDFRMPFSGGFAGYVSYDYAWKIENLPVRKPFSRSIPLAEFWLFEDYVAGTGNSARIFGKMDKRKKKLSTIAKSQTPDRRFTEAYSISKFKSMISKAHEYIRSGDIYQANLSRRFETRATTPFQTYLNLRQINPSPFGAYLETEAFSLACNSPERLFCKRGETIESRPIAGTRKPGSGQRDNLKRSPKENAEHIMLVDLERNDLGRLAREPVVADELQTVEKYSHVQHLVTNIRGVARKGIGAKEIVHAMFPGGTITGCPKVRAMEIIDELEPYRRGLYTGSLGYFSLNGNVDLNIIIRSPIFMGKKAYLHAGAGIVHDSKWGREYDEILSKTKAMMQAVV